MPAAKWFDEIILSDYTPANLEAQKQWLNKDKDAADCSNFSAISHGENKLIFIEIMMRSALY
jgi:hypothetical protein